jgi:tetratricopeptide (TPR) repeat protein
MQLLKRFLGTRAHVDTGDAPARVSARGRLELEPATSAVAKVAELAAQGNCAKAMTLVNQALEQAPDDPSLLFIRASTLFSWGRYREGRDELAALAARGVGGFDFHLKLGWADYWTGDVESSERRMRLAVEAKPEDWSGHFGLGNALHARKKYVEARSSFARALELNPDDPYCIGNLVGCEMMLGHLDVAEQLARRAVDIDPSIAVGWSNLGAVLDHQDRYSEAIDAFRTAEAISERAGELQYDFVNYAVCLFRDGRTNEGIAYLERRLREYPAVLAHSHYALTLLLSGRTQEGFEQYEFRWLDGPLKARRPNFPKPAWNGQNLGGKTILLCAEQGYGDFIQFIRYAPHIKALGAKVLLYLPEIVRKLADQCDGVDHVLLPDEPFPPFDFFVNMMSLPRIFGAEPSAIPAATPYLRADPARVADWPELANRDSIKVGLVWAGSPTHLRDKFRSLTIRQLAPLGRVPGVRLFSLQKGPATAQLTGQDSELQIVNLEPRLDDFVDTAAAIMQLDLVVCVDTSVAHLAGALGKPVWVMLPIPADWRWGESGDATHWYPTMRFFRQSVAGIWDDVITRVTEALSEFASVGPSIALSQASATGPRVIPLTPRISKLRIDGLSSATYTRVGMLQYWPGESPVGVSLGYYGEWLQPQLDTLGRMVKPGATVLEVGSGIGVAAVYLGKAVGAAGHLMLYESRPVVQRVLRQNLASNGIGCVTIMRNRIGGPPADRMEAVLTTLPMVGTDAGASSVIETVDDLHLARLDWLKVTDHDTPIDVLRGADSTLWRLRPLLFLAAPNAGVLRGMATVVRACSYRTWKIETALFNPVNFNVRNDDIFCGRTALALLAVPEEIEMDIVVDGSVEIH